MGEVWAVIVAMLVVGAAVRWALGLELISPLDGKHDDILYELLGYPLRCRMCLAELVRAEFDGIVTIRCPRGTRDAGHSHFRWRVGGPTR